MPIYEYECQECGKSFDKLVRSTADIPTVTCPHCQSDQVQKAISLFGLGGAKDSASSAACSTGPI